MSKRSKRTGFSVIELFLVLTMAALMLGVLLAGVHKARAAQVRQETVNKLKQIVLACHNCNDTYRKLPPAFDKFAMSQQETSVHVHLLPFLEQARLYKEFLDNGKVEDFKVPTFVTQDDPSTGKKELPGIQNFAANLRVFSDNGLRSRYDADMPEPGKTEPGTASIPRSFTDGTSNTILFATKYGQCGTDGGSRYAAAPNTKTAAFFGQNAAKVKAHPSDKTATFQLRPEDKDCCVRPLMAQSFTKAGLQVGLADGSVRTVPPELTPFTWNAALHPNDGMPLGPDW